MEKMEGQYRSFQSTLSSELEKVERAFIQERADLLTADKKELETLMERRRENEK